MDPCRIRSYLQVACAGLGFEIGEIWWTSNEHGSSTVAAIEEKPSDNGSNSALVQAGGQRKLRFVQLYTSKSYANRRDMLVTPPEDDDEEEDCYGMHDHSHQHHHDHECTAQDLEKHKLSPRLVDAISKTAQVVWANTVKQEGLTGRSDIPLHTAVGMPVALDANGNMCVVVMFSPSNIQSTDEAMEYLQSISRSATSSNIPCLMPAFDNTEEIQHVPTASTKDLAIRGHIMPQEASLGEGVTARFVSIDDDKSGSSTPEEVRGHDLASAPKDCFGIPMLPIFAELGDANAAPAPAPVPAPAPAVDKGRTSPAFEDVFDEASYGVWSTIMQDRPQVAARSPSPSPYQDHQPIGVVDNGIPMGLNEGINPAEEDTTDPKSLIATHKRTMDPKRKEQLEEFCSAFLGMSVFDIADVWIPAGPEQPGCLSHVITITAGSNQSNAINEFKRVSGYTLIKFWSGAVGRAYSSGNPVWSCNPDVYIDKGRESVFERANIMTAFAVPILSGKRATPVGVVCCYSMIQSGSVPFVLRFVQQALHLLWSGLDKVEPHKSVGQEIWQDVGPADLGEMAADVEMQHHFISKKRPHNSISFPPAEPDQSEPLSNQLKNLGVRRDRAYSFSDFIPVEDGEDGEEKEAIPEFYNFQHSQQQDPSQQMSAQAMHAFQNHIKQAVKQVGEALPFTHSHIATTADGSKRAHVAHQADAQHHPQHHAQHHPKPRHVTQPAPLAMPHALPTRVVKSSHHHHAHSADHGVNNHLSPQLMPPPSSRISSSLAGNPMGPSLSAPTQNFASSQRIPPPNPPQFTQQMNHQTMPVQTSGQPSGPSRLSQNLLSEGMLQSIASQQYRFAYESGLSRSENQDQLPQYVAPVAHMSVGLTAPSGGTAPVGETNGLYPQQQPAPLQNNTAFCMPTSAGYESPELTQSTPVASAPNGKGKVKMCRIQGCDEPSVVRRPYCARHSGNRLCEHVGCGKCAQGSTRFCIAHGGGRRCTFPGCDKGARDKFFCAAHGGGKRCKADGCNKSAVGGSSLCTAHGGGRRCAVDGCDKSAQSSTKFCVKHGGGKKCCHEGCEKVARGRTQYCAAHGGGVRCKLEGCHRVAIGKMQLCRAHGGGSRARTKTSANLPTPPPMQAGAPIYGTPTVQSFSSMEHPTATSV